jgi:hypothetical protein
MGIEAVPTGCVNATMEFLDDYPGNRTGPIPGYLLVGTFSYTYYAGTTKIVVAEEGPHFFVDVDSLVRVYANLPKVAEDDAVTIFLAPQVARTASGFPLYKNGSIVITRIPRPVFLPVSVEQFLQAGIRQAQTELAKLQAERGRDSTAYTRWLADRDKRQGERERQLQELDGYQSQSGGRFSSCRGEEGAGPGRNYEAQNGLCQHADNRRAVQATGTRSLPGGTGNAVHGAAQHPGLLHSRAASQRPSSWQISWERSPRSA